MAEPHPFEKHANTLDIAAMRALAHPLRLRILDELSMFGAQTASGLGARLGESSGATSYHLRQLEKHGLVREIEGRGTARERWWERPPGAISSPPPSEFPPASAERLASRLITDEWVRARETNLHEFLDEGEAVFGPEWLEIATASTINLRLTPEQLRGLVRELEATIDRYIDDYKATPSPGSRPTQLHLNAFPLVRGEPTPEEG